MKCTLYHQNIPMIKMDLTLTPYTCEVKSAFALSILPDPVKYLQSPDGDLDLGCISVFLTNRIPHTIKCMSYLDLLQFLNLKDCDSHFSTEELPLFLASFLWHLELGDGISVYPNQTEYLCFTHQDERFPMVYRVSGK